MSTTNKTRNAKRTKEKILKVAEKIFAQKGYAKTTIDDIAKMSNTSGALIIFHFKNKATIYSAVKSSIIQRYIDNNTDKEPLGDSMEDKIAFIVTSTYDFYKKNPRMLRLSNWAKLEGDIDPWPGEDDLHHNFIKIIEELQNSDQIRKDLTPMNILIMISGSIHIWWEYHKHFINHYPDEISKCTADDKYKDELLLFIMHGLSKQ